MPGGPHHGPNGPQVSGPELLILLVIVILIILVQRLYPVFFS